MTNKLHNVRTRGARIPRWTCLFFWFLGPTFSLVYINDFSENIKSKVRLFADDTIVSCCTPSLGQRRVRRKLYRTIWMFGKEHWKWYSPWRKSMCDSHWVETFGWPN